MRHPTRAERAQTNVLDGASEAARRVWTGQAPALSLLLLPAEVLFRLAQRAYHAGYDLGLLPRAGAPVPTISVGNLAVGGAGKTPVTCWLVDRLLERGEQPAVLHGGYAPDEPALHALWHPTVPVYADRDRARSAARAARAGATVLVLDDGFQHRRLQRDLDIVLVAAEHWHGHAHLLPRGPWRESPGALRRAQVLAVTRRVASSDRAEEVARALVRHAPGIVVARFALEPAGWQRWPAGTPVDEAAGACRGEATGSSGSPPAGPSRTPPPGVAVCGIADPDAFLENARGTGARIEGALVFRDHHAFTTADARRIRRAASNGAVLTTAKDAVRLAGMVPELALWVLAQRVTLEAGGPAVHAALERTLRGG